MSKLNCEITIYGNRGHIQQILTGYFMLKQQGIVHLTSKIKNTQLQDIDKTNPFKDAKKYHIKVVLNNEIVIYYDMHDSYEIDKKELYKADIYFKRSYLGTYIDTLYKNDSKKIFPLGLNYLVYPNKIDIQNIKRSLLLSSPAKEKLGILLRAINAPTSFTNAPKLKDLQELPLADNITNKKILFMVRTWDPYNKKDRSSDAIDKLNEINETRALCIRALKKEFGKDFYGGFSQTPHTLKYYKDCIVPNNNLTTRNKYLNLLKQYPICIATTGLHGSIGWKFGEYVAMSKAIVSEKLVYSLPGNFEAGQNYLEFKSPSECVEKTLLLYENDKKRYEMMINNANYYYHNLKPDSLVYNTILKTLSMTF